MFLKNWTPAILIFSVRKFRKITVFSVSSFCPDCFRMSQHILQTQKDYKTHNISLPLSVVDSVSAPGFLDPTCWTLAPSQNAASLVELSPLTTRHISVNMRQISSWNTLGKLFIGSQVRKQNTPQFFFMVFSSQTANYVRQKFNLV